MAINSNYVRYVTHIGWEEVSPTVVFENTILETIFKDMMEEVIDDLLDESEQ